MNAVTTFRRQVVRQESQPATGERLCVLEAAAGIDDSEGPIEAIVADLEAELEEIAYSLEGDGDQALILRGDGEDGELCLAAETVDVHASLADYRAWLRTGSPRPAPRMEARFRVELQGPEEAIHSAVARFTQTLSGAVALRSVVTSWRSTEQSAVVPASGPIVPQAAELRSVS
jgi:hypothetical protein